jgi:hypothetical protein
MDSNSVWTISAVISLTCLVVSQIKIWLGNLPVVRAIPLIVVAVAVAMGVTILAHLAGYLPGTTGQLLSQTVLAALGSGGLYNVLTGSALQRMDITKTAPTTKGTNSMLVSESPDMDADTVEVDHTPVWPAVILLFWIGTIFMSGCAFLNQQATQNQKLYNAKQTYLSALEFFTFLRDENVVTQKWVNEQKHIFDDVQLAYKIWEIAVQTGGDVQTAEQRFNEAADVLSKLRAQYEQATTKPVAKVNEYDDRGNPRARATFGYDWCPGCA